MTEVELDDVIFFKKGDEFSDIFWQLAEVQHNKCCSLLISSEYMNLCQETFTHGFMILGETPEEDRGYRGYEYFLKAFVLFEYKNSIVSGKTIKGNVICSNKANRGLGRILLQEVEKLAIENGVSRWIINALAFEKLISYYMRFGFEKYKEDDQPGIGKKTIKMIKKFNNEEDFYNYEDSDEERAFEKPYPELKYISSTELEDISNSLYRI